VDFPLQSRHRLAFAAAEAASCAGDQQKYWEMHDRLFAHQGQLEPWSAHARALGLDVPAFEECLNSHRNAAAIRRGMAEARLLGVASTPYFLLGRTEAEGTKVRVVTVLQGARPFAAFKEPIDRLLADSSGPTRDGERR
jgi:protein-disulfide isomerase